MKILITGCTSQQASKKHAERTPTFASLLQKRFQEAGVEAHHQSPSISWTEKDLSEYDLVVVGVTPPTSLAANRAYPAFIAAETARKTGNLALMIDSPESFKMTSALTTWKNPEQTFKSFYDRRKNYLDVVEDKNLQAKVHSFVEFLSEEKWPTTFYPTFPWSDGLFASKINGLEPEATLGVSVDSYLIFQQQQPKNFYSNDSYWTSDAINTEFSKTVANTLSYPVLPTKRDVWQSQPDTLERIRSSVGTIVSTYRFSESWWSPALAQSLSQGVPVVHDWRRTNYLGQEWGHLATSIESMEDFERDELAYSQKQLYLAALPDINEISESLLSTIKQLV